MHPASQKDTFRAVISSSDPVDPTTAAAFKDVLVSIDAAVRRANESVETLQAEIRKHEVDNENQRRQNQDLEAQISRLKNELNRSTAVTDPPVAPVGVIPETSELPASDDSPISFQLDRELSHRILDQFGQPAWHSQPVHSVAISPDCDRIASASWDASVKLYDLENEAIVNTFHDTKPGSGDESTKMGGLYSVAFSNTNKDVLGCTSADQCVYLWDHKTGKCKTKLVGHTNEVNGLDFHDQQQVMCTASDDMKVIIWDFGEGITLRTLTKHTKEVYGATFLGEKHQFCVATCCFDTKIRIFDMRDKQLVYETQENQMHTDDVIGISYSNSQGVLATGSDDGGIAIWDGRNSWQNRQLIKTRSIGGRYAENEVKRLVFNKTGDLLAAACSQGVLVYRFKGGKMELLADLNQCGSASVTEPHSDCVFDVAWGTSPSTGKSFLVSASHDQTSRIWYQN